MCELRWTKLHLPEFLFLFFLVRDSHIEILVGHLEGRNEVAAVFVALTCCCLSVGSSCWHKASTAHLPLGLPSAQDKGLLQDTHIAKVRGNKS